MRLTLRRERLCELAPADLEAVVGAGPTFTCTCLLAILISRVTGEVAPVTRDVTTLLPTGHCGTDACA